MDKELVAQRWSEFGATSDAFSSDVYWLAIPAVMARYQRLACAGMDYPSWVEYCVNEFGGKGSRSRALSIGCGHGALERHLYRLNAFESCDAFDIAPVAIEAARDAARAIGASSINYVCTDIEKMDFGRRLYDSAWFNMSLHHIEPLELVLRRMNVALKDDGLLFLNEYVGPSRFGFPPAQRQALEHAFKLIPPAYRKSFHGGEFRTGFGESRLCRIPRRSERVDPSESVRSADILSVLAMYFDIVALNRCGGTLLQFLLSGIAGNFREDDRRLDDRAADAVCDRGCLDCRQALGSDFVVVVARPKRV